MSFEARLDAAIKSVCPIHGVSIGRKWDKSTWRIDFRADANADQRSAARSVLDAFDVSVDVPFIDQRQAAIDALLFEQAKRADAPQAVKDYVEAK